MASGNVLCRFGPAATHPPAANYATPDVRNGLLVLDFDPNVDEAAVFVDTLPPNYAGGGLTVRLRWMATTAVTGTARWIAQIERHLPGTDDSDVDSWSAPQTAGTAAVAPSGTEMVTSIPFTNAQMDGLVVGERFRLRIFRDADSSLGTDDMAGDAELVQVDILET